MRTFDTLYSLDKKGKVRIFNIRVQQAVNENIDQSIWGIFSETGLIHGKQTTKVKEVTKGKNIGRANETTPYEQAVSEAKSKYNDKLDEGYKSNDMCIIKYQYDFQMCVDTMLIKANTNADWNELPMLAEPIKKVKNIAFPIFMQPKLNGVRCICKLDDNEEIIFLSRGGKYYIMPHIKAHLKNYFRDFPYHVLDGELFTKGEPLGKIAGACRRESEDKDISWVEYHVYDMAVPNISQKGRHDKLETLFPYSQTEEDPIQLVQTVVAHDREQIKKFHDVWVSEGYEGAIGRDPDSPYLFGFRDKRLIKVKEFIDEEFQLIGCKVTEGKSIGDSFVFTLSNNTNNLVFHARPRGTREQKEEWYSNRDWLSKDATVRYQERTEDGLPHQAHVVVIRDYE